MWDGRGLGYGRKIEVGLWGSTHPIHTPIKRQKIIDKSCGRYAKHEHSTKIDLGNENYNLNVYNQDHVRLKFRPLGFKFWACAFSSCAGNRIDLCFVRLRLYSYQIKSHNRCTQYEINGNIAPKISIFQKKCMMCVHYYIPIVNQPCFWIKIVFGLGNCRNKKHFKLFWFYLGNMQIWYLMIKR